MHARRIRKLENPNYKPRHATEKNATKKPERKDIVRIAPNDEIQKNFIQINIDTLAARAGLTVPLIKTYLESLVRDNAIESFDYDSKTMVVKIYYSKSFEIQSFFAEETISPLPIFEF